MLRRARSAGVSRKRRLERPASASPNEAKARKASPSSTTEVSPIPTPTQIPRSMRTKNARKMERARSKREHCKGLAECLGIGLLEMQRGARALVALSHLGDSGVSRFLDAVLSRYTGPSLSKAVRPLIAEVDRRREVAPIYWASGRGQSRGRFRPVLTQPCASSRTLPRGRQALRYTSRCASAEPWRPAGNSPT